MKLVGLVAVAALVVGVLISVLVKPVDSGVESGGATVEPTSTVSSAATKQGDVTVGAQEPGVGGMNIRYLGQDGQTKQVDVKDFRR